MSYSPHVVGLDLSLRASGVIRIPVDWQGDWSRVEHDLIEPGELPKGSSDRERIFRCDDISEMVRTTVDDYDYIYIENYAFGQKWHAHYLGELGGIVRLKLASAAGNTDRLWSVPSSTARKLFFGKTPKGDVKKAVRDALATLGAPSWLLGQRVKHPGIGRSGNRVAVAKTSLSLDLADAFVIANWGLAHQGAFHFAGVASSGKPTGHTASDNGTVKKRNPGLRKRNP